LDQWHEQEDAEQQQQYVDERDEEPRHAAFRQLNHDSSVVSCPLSVVSSLRQRTTDYGQRTTDKGLSVAPHSKRSRCVPLPAAMARRRPTPGSARAQSAPPTSAGC